jgi:hypothetical protein
MVRQCGEWKLIIDVFVAYDALLWHCLFYVAILMEVCEYCHKKLRPIKEDSTYCSWNRLFHKVCWLKKKQDMCYEMMMEELSSGRPAGLNRSAKN